MDALVAAANVSSRTLYKRYGSKDGLIAAMLRDRCQRFCASIDGDELADLFATLARWSSAPDARGCMFLRAMGELAGHEAVTNEVTRYHRRLQSEIAKRTSRILGRSPSDRQVLSVLMLFEGAAVVSARECADTVCATAAYVASSLVPVNADQVGEISP